jgi:hypothetical protein
MKRLAIEQMAKGTKQHGLFDAKTDTGNRPEDGKQEDADSANYADMEAEKVLMMDNVASEEMRGKLLLMLDGIRAASLQVGVQWCEYEELKEEIYGDRYKVKILEEKETPGMRRNSEDEVYKPIKDEK